MGLKINDERVLVKRSTVSGVVPTIPGSGVTDIYDYTAGGWLNTDIYVGEFFLNTADDKLWFRSDNGINLVAYSGQSNTFIDLVDVPSTYTANKYLVVNSSATALEWTDITSISDFINLVDTPSTYSGYSGQTLKVNSGETGLEFGFSNCDFINLVDTPSTYSGAEYLLRINSGSTGLEFFDGATTYVDLDSIQTINSSKTFLEKTTFNEIDVTGDIIYSGLTYNDTINDILTDTSLTNFNDQTLATSKAIKYYVDSIAFGTGVTNYVTTNTNQYINGEKQFNDDTFFSNIEVSGDIDVSGDLNTNNIFQSISSYHYYGDSITDGSFRTFINTLGHLETQKLISGTWTFMNQI